MTVLEGKAAQIVGPGRAEVVTVPVRPLQENEVLVRGRWATVCGSDLHVVHQQEASGLYPMPPGYPGHEGVGQVVESRSDHFGVGDWVLQLPDRSCCELFSQYHVSPDRFLVRLPEGDARLKDYLMAQQLGTALFALKRFLHGGLPRRVATVVGLGSAGLHFVQLLRLYGFERIVAADLVRERVELARSYGLDSVVLEPEESVIGATMNLSEGKGADLSIDASSSDAGRNLALRCVAQDGTVGLFGLPMEPMTSIPLGEIFRRCATLKTAVAAQHEPGIVSFHEAVEMVRQGQIDVRSMVTHTLGLDELTEGLELASDCREGVIKVAIDLA